MIIVYIIIVFVFVRLCLRIREFFFFVINNRYYCRYETIDVAALSTDVRNSPFRLGAESKKENRTQVWVATSIARMDHTCVYRTRQRYFGVRCRTVRRWVMRGRRVSVF